MFIPYEIIILGAMLYFHKKDIEYKAVNNYIKRRQFHIELENEDEFQFIKATKNGFHVDKIPPMNPAIMQFLMQ